MRIADPEQGPTTNRITVRLHRRAMKAMRTEARKKGLDISELARMILDQRYFPQMM